MTSLWYEILPVTLQSNQVVWLRRREDGEAHPWRIAHQAGLHPNDAVLAHVKRLFGERFEPEVSIIHSCAGYLCYLSARIGLGEPPITPLAPCLFPRGRVPSQACTCSSSPRRMDTVQGMLIFILPVARWCLRWLHHCFVSRTTPDTTSLLLGTLTDLARRMTRELKSETCLFLAGYQK